MDVFFDYEQKHEMSAYQKLYTEFSDWLNKSGVYSETTIEPYLRIIVNFLRYLEAFSVKSLNHLSYDLFFKFLHQRRDNKPYAKDVVKNRVSVLDLFFAWANENTYCKENPVVTYKKSKIIQKPLIPTTEEKSIRDIKILQPKEQETILKKCVSNDFVSLRDKSMAVLILTTGLFVEELICLQRGNLSLKNQTVEITGEGKRERSIWFDTNVKEILAQWESIRDKQLNNQENIFYYITSQFAQISRRVLYKAISNYLQKCGIEKQKSSPIVLRQTAICKLIKEGHSVEEIKNLTGIKTSFQIEAYKAHIL